MAENITIFPPIIDNTISAFETDWEVDNQDTGAMHIVFYQQSEERSGKINGVTISPEIRDDYVLVSLKAGGESLLKDSNVYIKNVKKVDIQDNSDAIKYSITINKSDLIDGYFRINTQMQVTLASMRFYESNTSNEKQLQEQLIAIASNSDGYSKIDFDYIIQSHPEMWSQWSDVAIKYALPKMTFTLWGGVPTELASQTPPWNSAHIANLEPYKIQETKQTIRAQVDEIYHILGQISFAEYHDPTIPVLDEILWYQIKVLNTSAIFSTELIPTTERSYPDRTFWDNTGRSFHFEIDDLGTILTNTQNLKSIAFAVIIATDKGLLYTNTYSFSYETSEEEDVSIETNKNLIIGDLQVVPCPSRGSNFLTFKIIDKEKEGERKDEYYEGVINYSRTRMDQPNNWQIFYQERGLWNRKSSFAEGSSFSFEDKTIEPGVAYKYRVQFFHNVVDKDSEKQYQATESKNIVDDVLLLCDDIFLMTKNASLKIAYNPNISNFKQNVQTIIAPTLGGAYPFVRRSGKQKYKTFSFGGLIAFESERYANNTFNQEVITLLNLVKSEDEFKGSLFVNLDSVNSMSQDYYAGATGYDLWRIQQRLYRDMVIDFLYKNQVFLYKSSTEGNIFIVLSDISFTPNIQLGRNIYSFTATATEVEEASAKNYLKYFGENKNNIEYSLTKIYSPFAHFNTSDKTFTSFSESAAESAIEQLQVNELAISETAYSQYRMVETKTQTYADGNRTTVLENALPILAIDSYIDEVWVKVTKERYDAHKTEDDKKEVDGEYFIRKTIKCRNIYPATTSFKTDAVTTDEKKGGQTDITINECEINFYQDQITFLT